VNATMREALFRRTGFAVPEPFAEIATRFAQRAGGIAEGLELLEHTLELRIRHCFDDRYETMPIEFFPLLDTGGDGHCFGYAIHAPELEPHDYPMGSMVPGESDGVIFAGDTTPAAMEYMISYMRDRPDGFADIDLAWLATIGLAPDRAKAGQVRRLAGDTWVRPSPAIPGGWRHVMTSDGIGVVAPVAKFNPNGTEPLPTDASPARYIAAADAETAAGHHGSALCYLKEAWWWAYFSPRDEVRQVRDRLVRAYEALGKTLLADTMGKYYTWLS
jgi:hypothetical protein